MESIECVQGQAEGTKGPQDPGPMSGELPQDVLQSFGVQESQEDTQPLVRKLDLLHLRSSLNFHFLMLFHNFLLCFFY